MANKTYPKTKPVPKPQKQSAFLPVAISIVLAIIAVAAIVYFGIPKSPQEEKYVVTSEGILQYKNRLPLKYEEVVITDNEHILSKKVIFENRGVKVYGLLVLPKKALSGANRIPAAVILPGARITKEEEAQLPNDLNDLGIATLVLDQRGTGETGGSTASPKEDFDTYAAGGEPVAHLMVYDALRAFDYLAMQKNVDASKILIAGESLGGRNAIIAAAIEPRAKGVVVVGTSGFNVSKAPSAELLQFFRSVDPDNYIGRIAPRKVVMMHAIGDTIVPIGSARYTFSKAKDPKVFIEADYSGHGYNANTMRAHLENEVKDILGANQG